jgi:hypothetical protein
MVLWRQCSAIDGSDMRCCAPGWFILPRPAAYRSCTALRRVLPLVVVPAAVEVRVRVAQDGGETLAGLRNVVDVSRGILQ